MPSDDTLYAPNSEKTLFSKRAKVCPPPAARVASCSIPSHTWPAHAWRFYSERGASLCALQFSVRGRPLDLKAVAIRFERRVENELQLQQQVAAVCQVLGADSGVKEPCKPSASMAMRRSLVPLPLPALSPFLGAGTAAAAGDGAIAGTAASSSSGGGASHNAARAQN